MTVKRVSADPTVAELLAIAIGAASAADAKYAIGGALAMQAHGYKRSTDDVDLYVTEADVYRVLFRLKLYGMKVMPVFAPHHYVAHPPGSTDPEKRIDVMVPAGEPELSAIEWADTGRIFGIDAEVFPIDLLVFAKAYSDRPEDAQDLAAMLHRGMFDPEAVRRLIASVDRQGAKDFEELMVRLTTKKAARKKPTKRLPKRSKGK